MNVTVIGAGGWGCALAKVLSDNGHNVIVWSSHKKAILELSTTNMNRAKLNDIVLPSNIKYTLDIEEALKCSEIVVIATTSRYVRAKMQLAKPYLKKGMIVINVAKGIENETMYTLDKVIKEEAPDVKVAILSGPSHAEEVARNVPTSVVVGSEDEEVIRKVIDLFMNKSFRVYGSKDVIGIEIGAALKNVIALAAGICDGLGYGDNTKAALMTRGMAEITRLGMAMGAKHVTFNGLSGIGDLIVTCTSLHSRNKRAGVLIGQGASMEEALKEVQMVVEGVYSAQAAYHLAQKYNVEMPITEQVNRVLFEGIDPKKAVVELMSREKKYEHI